MALAWTSTADDLMWVRPPTDASIRDRLVHFLVQQDEDLEGRKDGVMTKHVLPQATPNEDHLQKAAILLLLS